MLRPLLAVACCLAALGAPPSAAAQSTRPGDIDRSFGRDGLATGYDAVDTNAGGGAVARDAQGRVYAAGPWESDASRLVVSRWLPSGELDQSWAGQGTSRITMPDNLPIFGVVTSSAAMQPDGKLVIAGTFHNEFTGLSVFVTRLNAGGTLDTGFGTNGFYRRAFSPQPTGLTLAAGVAVQGSRIVFTATAYDSTGSTPGRLVVAGLTSGGVIDPTFANGGPWVLQYGAGTPPVTIAGGLNIQADGTIWVPGASTRASQPTEAFVAKFDAAGQPVTTWGTGGVLKHDANPGGTSGAQAVLQRDDGRLVVVQTLRTTGQPIRIAPRLLDASGTPDTGFGPTGQREHPVVGAGDTLSVNGAALDGAGRLVVAANQSAPYDPSTTEIQRLVLARFGRDGTLDPLFGFGGLRFGVDSGIRPGGNLVIDAEDRALVAQGGAVTRFHGGAGGGVHAQPTRAGELDQSFGDRGGVRLQLGAGTAPKSVVSDVVAHGDRGFVLAGQSTDASGVLLPTLARVTRDGRLDATFQNGRTALPTGLRGPARWTRVETDEQSRLIAAGYAESSVPATDGNFTTIVARFTPDGALDGSYGTGGIVLPALQHPGSQHRAIPYGLVVDDGKATIAGPTFDTGEDAFVVRLDADGNPDPTFAGDGVVFLLDLGVQARFLTALEPRSGGGYWAIGQSGPRGPNSRYESFVAAITAAGTADPDFSGDGHAYVYSSPSPNGQLGTIFNSLHERPDGKLVTGGGTQRGVSGEYVFSAMRLLPDGSPDPDYGGGDGLIYNPIPATSRGSAAVTPDGKLLYSGFQDDKPATRVLARFRDAGDPDLAFGSRADRGRTWGSAREPGGGIGAIEIDGTHAVLAGAAVQRDFSQGISVERMRLNTPPQTGASGPGQLAVGTVGRFGTVDPRDADAAFEYDDTDIRSTAWDFGDGVTATGDAVEHAYAAPGTYTARVTLTDQYGSTGSATVDVVVPGPGAGAGPGDAPGPGGPGPGPGATPTPGPVTARPTPVKTTVALPSARTCVSRRQIALTVRSVKGVRIKRLDIYVGKKRVKRVTRTKAKQKITLKGLPRGTYTVKVVALLGDGRTVTDKRTYKTCAPKKKRR